MKKVIQAVLLAGVVCASSSFAETRILFVASPGGVGARELYTMKDDGTDLTRVTSNSISEWAPALSPDSNTVAYVQTEGTPGIYFTTLTGEAPVNVCTGPVFAVQWADTNTLFYVKASGGSYALWKVNRNGASNQQAYATVYGDWTLGIESFCIDRPAGRLYVPLSSGKSRLNSGPVSGAVFDAVYPVLSPLNGTSDIYTPAISSNGLKIAYSGDYGGGQHRVYASNKDGSGTATVVSVLYSASPSWGPDGTWIVCTTNAGSTYGMASYVGNIAKFKSDGSGLISSLTATSSVAGSCAFPIVYQAPSDGNANGMADAWEKTYFGGFNATNSGPNEDRDGDGFSNLGEYIAGTDPTTNSSMFTIQMASSNGNLVVMYNGLSSTNPMYDGLVRTYDLMYRSNLADTTWLPVPGQTNVVGSNTLQQYILSNTNSTMFFKVKARLK